MDWDREPPQFKTCPGLDVAPLPSDLDDGGRVAVAPGWLAAPVDRDAALHRLAAPSNGVVSRDALVATGMTADQLHRRLRCGLLVRLQPAVYAVASVPASFEQRILAACLSAGPTAAASHRSAARLWKLRGAASERVEVTVPGGSRPRLARVVVHRSQVFGAVDMRTVSGIPVTRPERTLVDSAAVLPLPVVRGYLESALGEGLTTVDRIWSYLSRYGGRGRRGSGVLRGILADRDPSARPTESSLEDHAAAVLRRYGLPAPVRQYAVGRYRLDLAYPELHVAVEVDSARWHSDSASYRRDRDKWNLLTQGWVLLIVTEFDLHERPAGVAADLTELLCRVRCARRG